MVLVGKPKGTKPLGTSKRRCEYNSKLDRKGPWEGIIGLKTDISGVLL
jgi:hypothetical protein